VPTDKDRGKRAVHSQRYKFMLRQLRIARKEAGMTQVEVARALGRTQAFVSKCELGERRIDPLDLQEYATLYKKAFAFFLPAFRLRRP
jgi:transcriptional regulator with XRE-family HTH domain